MWRYVVFAGKDYYPNGGFEDFIGSRKTRDEALSFMESITSYDWLQIVDTEILEFETFRRDRRGRIAKGDWLPVDKWRDAFNDHMARRVGEET